ncbi:hypothetical protein MSG28_007572 [Choristoneura fumiferana]|uniref:Uncharacterized protein n=1 Tax=Choristoneura fumiferana TaxID=7141 RepID=A0ACC0JY24_CHOFU|nr:hypothetical protein MSG28_007572 [Choristoneura fumiferana]
MGNINVCDCMVPSAILLHKSKVICCPLWLCMICIIIINILGAVLCALRIRTCWSKITGILARSLLQYRSAPKYKHFMDSVQWNLRCCGLNSYKDWFSRDWYDKIRDYEWDPNDENFNKLNQHSKQEAHVTDSVPLSCCKSGSCIANYLTEMGTSFINVRGCGTHVHRIVLVTLAGHLFVFVSVILVETILLILIKKQSKGKARLEKTRISRGGEYNVKHIMTVRDNFDVSSGSVQMDSDEDEIDDDAD